MRDALTRYRPALVFLGKMLAVYVVWFVAYDLWLQPDGRLAAWIGHNAAVLSGGVLDALGIGAHVTDRTVWLDAGTGVLVDDDCTGLSTVGLFVGFVLAFPGRWTRRLLFVPLGILVIHLANVGRIAFLAWLYGAWPQYFDAIHEWGILPFFYAVVFVLWMVWVRVGSDGEISDRDGTTQDGSGGGAVQPRPAVAQPAAG